MASLVVLMLLLRVLALSAPVLAIPSEYEMDILGLLGADSNTFLSPSDTHGPTPSPFTSAKFALSTLQSSKEQPTPTLRTDSAGPTSIKTIFAPTPSVVLASAESNAVDHSSKTWQTVGVVIISVLFIATSITCAMFSDRLWRLLRDVVCCTCRPDPIPDCEKQSWDTRSIFFMPSHSTPREEATVQARALPWDNNDHWNTFPQ